MNISNTPLHVVILTVVTGLHLSAPPTAVAIEAKKPRYVRGDNFTDTMCSLHQQSRVWRQSAKAGSSGSRRVEAGRLAQDFEDQIARDYPVEWHAMVSELKYKTNRNRLRNWLSGDSDKTLFDDIIEGYVVSLARCGDLGTDEKEKFLAVWQRQSGNPTSQVDSADPCRGNLVRFANACHYLRGKELAARIRFLQRLAARLPGKGATQEHLIRLYNEQHIPSRIATVLRELGRLGKNSIAAIASRESEIHELPLELTAEIQGLQHVTLRIYLRFNGVEQVLFATRTPVVGYYHWYESFGYACDQPGVYNTQTSGSLQALDLTTGNTRTVFEDLQGGVRDPCISYDANRILFSYRPSETLFYNLYEIGVDGSGLRQITNQAFDDIEPVYLPDDDIVFCSSRARRWVPCLNAPVATLYRCRPDGSQVHPISANVETENTPCVLPDGRILFMRWEYVERDRSVPHGLWTINPDGTGQMSYWGNMNESDVFIDARPIPGTDRVIFVRHPHGSADHRGSVAILTPNDGPDEHRSIHPITPNVQLEEMRWHDPYPVADDIYLVVQANRLLVYDNSGSHAELFSLEEDETLPQRVWIHEPRVIAPRPREPILTDRHASGAEPATLILSNANHGRRMDGVDQGKIRKLLVLEIMPKPVHHDGHTENISWNGNFFIERLLGTVPVEEDGSAYFQVPSMRCVFFSALDDNNQSVKRMQSFVSLRPGEQVGCVGCHENRTQTPIRTDYLQALSKPPAQIQPLDGIPSIYHYPRDIQPIWDRHCLTCHDNDRREGNVVLNGDLGPFFSQSYVTLKARGLLAAGHGGVGGRGNAPPYIQGASPSRLMQLLESPSSGSSHYDVSLSDHELDLVRFWLESWAQYSGTYASLNNDPNEKIFVSRDVTSRRCAECHTDDFHRGRHADPIPADVRESMGLRINLSHPDQSLMLLAPLARDAGGLGICRQRTATAYAMRTDAVRGEAPVNNWLLGDAPPATIFADKRDPDYVKMHDDIVAAAARLLAGRVELPGFVPNEHWVREMKKHGTLPQHFKPDGRSPLQTYFEVDQAYYEMFWPREAKPSDN